MESCEDTPCKISYSFYGMRGGEGKVRQLVARNMIRTTWMATILSLMTTSPATADGPVVLATDTLRLEIDEDGTLASLTSTPETIEYAWTVQPGPVATVYRGGRSVPAGSGKYAASTGRWVYQGGESFSASRVSRAGDELRVEFSEADVTATYRVTTSPHYLGLGLVGLTGGPVDRIDLLRLCVHQFPQRGPWVNVAYSDRFGVCLAAGNVRTIAEMDEHSDHVMLRATAERDVALVGATTVLFGCHDPRATFLDAMAVVERDFDMPSGAENRRTAGQRHSYLWAARPTPENIDEYVKWARRGGFRTVLLSYTAFSTGAGHFEWKASYPRGMADLEAVTDTIRRAGLNVGLHIHYSKAHKSDPYVSPVPDDRLHEVRRFTLADDVDAGADTIPVDQSPAGCTLDEGRRILKAGHELIAYEGVRTDPVFLFTGCRRGHLGTEATAHRRGESLGLLNVDTWPAFIRFDQDTDLQDEVARRIAEIYRRTGPYELVYFDGAEDVHEPFWYHVASAQERVFRLLEPRPPVCEAAHYTHFSWHMITRSNAYDVVAPADGMKDFCRLMPCRTAAARVKDFSRIDFGWLGRFGKSAAGYAGPDVWEYVASRAAAWDCPISLKVTLDEIASNPRREDCFDAIRTWEDARLGDHLSSTQRESLKNVPPELARYVPCYDQRGIWENCRTGRNLTEAQRKVLANRQEHHLFLNEKGRYELVPIEEIHGVAGGTVKAFWLFRAGRSEKTYVLLWAVNKDVTLRLGVEADRLRVMRPFGTRVPVGGSGSEAVVTVGSRTYLEFAGLDAADVERVLKGD